MSKWDLSINLKPWNIINTRPKTWILCTSVAPCFIIQKKRYAHDFLKGKVEFFHARIINFLFTDRSTECICLCVCFLDYSLSAHMCVCQKKLRVHVNLIPNNAISIRGKWEWFERGYKNFKKSGLHFGNPR